MSRTVAAVAMLVLATAWGQESSQPPPVPRHFAPQQILANMPVNSDHRCVGISLAAAALLEGKPLADDECDRPEELARRIYEAAGTKSRVQFHRTLCLPAGPAPIQSREGLDALATAIADRYKQRHQQLIATPEGISKLRDAERKVLASHKTLDALLDADADHIVPFLVTGVRGFPGGDVKRTNHAVLIAKTADGEKVVYDPNDPGRPISCQIQTSSDGLWIKWTCRYRETGLVTTQEYQIVETDRFFREALVVD